MSRDTAVAQHAMDKSEERRLEEAAYWFVTLQHDEPSPDVLKRWKQWEKEPENREAFDTVERVWQLSDSVHRPPPASPQELAADHYDGSVPVSSWRSKRAVGSVVDARRSFVIRAVRLAATIGAIVLGLLFMVKFLGYMAYFEATPAGVRKVVLETGIAEHKELVFEDGTRIHLGAQTSVTASFTKDTRSVVLDRGEALFHVARDPKRPFHVNAGGGIITAVGTAFNVRRREDNDVVVTVTEGIVEITPSGAPPVRQLEDLERENSQSAGEVPTVQRLVRGQEVTFDAQGKIGQVRTAELDASAAWRDGRIKYRGEPLRLVLQDVNRYSRRQIYLGDPEAGNLLYSGTVFEREIDDWVTGLEKIFPEIEVVTVDDGRVLIRTRDTAEKLIP